MLRDTRILIDGTTIVHANLQNLESDDHNQYALTVGADRPEINVNTPQERDIFLYDSTSSQYTNFPLDQKHTVVVAKTGG